MTINVAGASGDRDLAAIDNTQLSEFTALTGMTGPIVEPQIRISPPPL